MTLTSTNFLALMSDSTSSMVMRHYYERLLILKRHKKKHQNRCKRILRSIGEEWIDGEKKLTCIDGALESPTRNNDRNNTTPTNYGESIRVSWIGMQGQGRKGEEENNRHKRV